jgi:hypothetical protein
MGGKEESRGWKQLEAAKRGGTQKQGHELWISCANGINIKSNKSLDGGRSGLDAGGALQARLQYGGDYSCSEGV